MQILFTAGRRTLQELGDRQTRRLPEVPHDGGESRSNYVTIRTSFLEECRDVK